MGRKPCCDKVGLKKGTWTNEEDKKLVTFILNNGYCCWRDVPKLAVLLRCGMSCRLRWTNYLRPDLKRGLLSEAEEMLVTHLHSQLGNRWAKIASHLPGRTDNEIKNHWNTHIKKKLRKMGIDPATHKPLTPTVQQQEQPSLSANKNKQNYVMPLVQSSPKLQVSEAIMAEEEYITSTFDYYTNELPMAEQPDGIIVSNCSSATLSSSMSSSVMAEEMEISRMDWLDQSFFCDDLGGLNFCCDVANGILDIDSFNPFEF